LIPRVNHDGGRKAAVNLIGSYDYSLVALSVLIAMLASYAALDLAGRVTAAGGWTRAVWLLGGAGAMGTGIWSMHYIGMLAFVLPVPVAYHWPTVLMSLFAVILASLIALYMISLQKKMGAIRAFVGSLLMGAGIASMHYTGIAAMRLPAVCHYDSFLVVLSVVFAFLISLAALWITFHFRIRMATSSLRKIAGAVVMGAAIPVMHYTDMAAASFTPTDMPVDLSHSISISTLGTAGIAVATLIVLGMALLTVWVDRRFAAQVLELHEEKLQQSEAYLSEAQRLSHTGSFGWRVSTAEITWSEETFRIFEYDHTMKPTVELVRQRIHPEDAVLVRETCAHSMKNGYDLDLVNRLRMPEGSVKFVHVVARPFRDESGGLEYIGSVMDITEQRKASEALEKAFDEIKKSQDRLRLVIDTIPSMVWSALPDGRVDFVSQSWVEYHGLSLEDGQRVGFTSIIHPEDAKVTADKWRASLRSGEPFEHEVRTRRADGEYRWFLNRAVPLRDELGNIIKWYATATDIEDRKRTENALRRSEAYLAAAQRISHTGSCGWNVSTGEIFLSEESYRIGEYDRARKLSIDALLERVHPDDITRVRETLDRGMQEGTGWDIEHRLLLPNGSVKYLHVVTQAVRDEKGDLEFWGTVMDVTEQHQARAALEQAFNEIKRSQDRLQLVIDTIPGLVWSVFPDGTTDFVNKTWVEYYGLTLEDLAREGWEVVIHPDDVPRARDIWLRATAAGKPYEVELRSRRADGQYRWVLYRAVPLRDEMGNVVRYYGANTDIEERKLAEMLLAEEKRLLEMIARGDPLALILDALCSLVEDLSKGSLSSILLLDRNTNYLRRGAAPNLPMNFIDGAAIGPSAGSCGTAAYRGETVIVSDIAADPLWADYRDLALTHGLRACWYTPILSSEGQVLGTFAIYYREPRNPTPQEQKLLSQITDLATIAIERDQAVEVLREQARLLDLTHDSVFVRDMSDLVTYWNRGAEELYGWTREEAVAKVSHQLMPTIFPAPLDEINAELLSTGRWEGELIHTKRDGTQVMVASRWSLQRDEQGLPAAILETNNDITERKRAEAKLRESEKRYRHIFQSAGVSIWEEDFSQVKMLIDELKTKRVSDFSQYLAAHPEVVEQAISAVKIIDVNEASVKLFGACSKYELMVSLDKVFLPETRDVFSKELIAIAEGRHNFESETVLQTLAGDRLVALFTITFPSPPATFESVLVTITDVTERKRAEQALRNAQTELAHVTRVTTLGEMTASIAHEMNQPLAAVVTNGGACLRWLMGETPNLEEAREAARRVIRDGNRASDVIARIRALLRKSDTRKEKFDINDSIQEIALLTQHEAARRGIALRLELSEGLLPVFGDPVQLQQVALNLVMNGVEAIASVNDGPRELVISSCMNESDQVLVAVRDSGEGIETENLEKIFDAFYTTKPQGMGMGLAISRSIVESHGGRLWAARNDGQGATFQFTLPPL